MDETDSYLTVMLSLSVSCFYAPIFIGAFFLSKMHCNYIVFDYIF
jgi:hypothetical protein